MTAAVNVVSIVVGLATIAGLVVAALSLRTQQSGAKDAAVMAGTLALFAEFRSKELTAAKRELSQRITAGTALVMDDATAMVAQFFAHAGFLVATGLVPADLVDGYLGDSARFFWRGLQPLIASERVRRGDVGYMAHFERLASR